MALQYVPFFKKRVCIKRMLQSDTLKNPDFAMSAKEQLLRGVLGCLVNKEKRKGKGKKNLREGRTCSESSPSLKDFYCYQLIVVLSNGRAEQSVFCLRAGAVKGISLFFLGRKGAVPSHWLPLFLQLEQPPGNDEKGFTGLRGDKLVGEAEAVTVVPPEPGRFDAAKPGFAGNNHPLATRRADYVEQRFRLKAHSTLESAEIFRIRQAEQDIRYPQGDAVQQNGGSSRRVTEFRKGGANVLSKLERTFERPPVFRAAGTVPPDAFRHRRIVRPCFSCSDIQHRTVGPLKNPGLRTCTFAAPRAAEIESQIRLIHDAALYGSGGPFGKGVPGCVIFLCGKMLHRWLTTRQTQALPPCEAFTLLMFLIFNLLF